ncbi:MAG: RNA methyltransferase [Candidatus Marinimicrobia bacterium]|nr:RNA methyltransferase [Candidatus Neomarinimicrobiota bacterium]
MISQKQVKSLHLKKYRSLNNQFIVEGSRSVSSAIDAKAIIDSVFYTLDFSKKNPTLLEKVNRIPSKIVSSKEIRKLSPSANPSGILATCKIPKFEPFNKNKNIIFLDNVSDPGNLGTILRTALWFGIDQIGYSSKSIDPYNPKVVRSAMGAHFSISWLGELSLDDIKGYKILGADHRGKSIHTINIDNQRWALIMGSEAQGISKSAHSCIDELIGISKVGEGESLNVGVSMGILLHELTK